MIGTRRSLICRRAASLDPVTVSWQQRVASNGGNVAPLTLAAVDIFAKRLRSSGLIGRIRMLNLLAGGSLAAAAVPLINLSGGIKHTLNAFVASDFAEALGLKTDGSSKYIDTGFLPDGSSTLGLSLYLRTALTGSSNVPMGCRDSGNTQVYRFFRNGIVTTGQVGGSVDQTQVTEASNSPAGFYHDIRTSPTVHKMYRGGNQIATSSTATTPASVPNTMFVFAQNGGAGASAYCPANTYISGYAIDDGTMSSADEIAYYNAWQAFQTSLGRQV